MQFTKSGAPLCNNALGRRDYGKKNNHGKPWNAEKKERAVSLYSDGKSLNQIAEIMGRSRSSIRHILIKSGIIRLDS